jgi:hypothetical protein
MRLVPKNWEKFQHYRDRCPPWIKLHKDLLNDRAFMCLPIASKALAPLLWLLASESKDGSFDASVEELQFRLRISAKDITSGLEHLISNGFFLHASNVLAECLQDAIPEREGERETETETEREGDYLPTASVNTKVVDLRATVRAPIVCPAQKIIETFHQACPTLQRVKLLNPNRRKHLSTRWREVDAESKLKDQEDGIEIFRNIFERVHESDFLCGRLQRKDNRNWMATFDWLILPTNFIKVCEGHYDNKRKAM